MSRKQGAALQPAGRHFVYDSDPDETTRPDTVPAALRFAEASALSSGVAHTKPRELKPYPRAPELTLPEIQAANDEKTVVDPPLARPREKLPSGPRHRAVATVSTVPPPSRARQKIPRAEIPVAHVEEPARVLAPRWSAPVATEQARITTSPPMARASKRLPFVPALVVTAVAAALFGTALGNGSLERAVARLHASPEARAVKPPPTVSPPVAAKRGAPLPASVAPSKAPAPPPETSDAPVIRVEDLPLAEEGKGTRTTRTGRPLRTKAARRR